MWTNAGYEAATVGSDREAVGEAFRAVVPVPGTECAAIRY